MLSALTVSLMIKSNVGFLVKSVVFTLQPEKITVILDSIVFVFRINFLNNYISVTRKYLCGYFPLNHITRICL